MKKLNEVEPVLTHAFQDIVLALDKAIENQTIIGIISDKGVGFKFAVKRFAMKHYLKIIYASVEKFRSFHQIICSLNEEVSNLKFSNINTRNTNLHTLSVRLNQRLKTDDTALLVLDNCKFTPAQLEYFIRFLKNFKCHCGLVFRMTPTFIKKISSKRAKFQDLYLELRKVTAGWKNISPITDDDVREIAAAHGVEDKMILNDLVAQSKGNVSILEMHIQNYFRLKKANQP